MRPFLPKHELANDSVYTLKSGSRVRINAKYKLGYYHVIRVKEGRQFFVKAEEIQEKLPF